MARKRQIKLMPTQVEQTLPPQLVSGSIGPL
jgi:hypothetical protein